MMLDLISAFLAGVWFVATLLAVFRNEAGWAAFYTFACLLNIVAALT